MKGVILAAGNGTRLAPHTNCRPKVLTLVGQQAIIDYTLDAFAQVGIRNVAVVVGYRKELVEEWVGDGSTRGLHIQYCFNRDYTLGNALSVYAARSFVEDEPFLLSMADHMVSPDLLSVLINKGELANRLAVDFNPVAHKIPEATKVWVDENGLVTRIGKSLADWNGLDAGVFLLNSSIFEAIEQIRCETNQEHQLSRAITYRLDSGYPLEACDISGSFWQDVDTLEDLVLVRNLFAGAKTWQPLTMA